MNLKEEIARRHENWDGFVKVVTYVTLISAVVLGLMAFFLL